MGNMADGLNFQPRVKEPESALEPGMSARAPQLTADGLPGVEALDMPDTSGPGAVAGPSPARWVYDFDPGTGSSRATFNGEVAFTSGGAATAGVTSWNTRTGAVALTLADVTGVGGAPSNSPTFVNANANTPAPGDSTTKVATTLFVGQAIAAASPVSSFNGRTGAITLTTGDVTTAGGAPVNSPALTGVPTTPTPSQGDASSKIASTMFVSNALASGAVTSWNGRQGAVSLSLSDVTSVGGAPISSPVFTGAPAGPTPTVGDASTRLATTAFVTNAITGATTGVASFNTRTGAVTLQLADVVGVGGAPIASPAFTLNPTAPTPTAGDSSTKLATTAFVSTAIGGLPPGVATFNGRQGTVTLQLTDVTSVGGAPLASPTFTGSPLTTTPAPGDNSTRIADTAFVAAAIAPLATTASVPVASTTTPIMDGSAAIGVGVTWAKADHVHPSDTSRLAVSGGTMTGAVNLKGVVDGSNAAAGIVGEFLNAGSTTLTLDTAGDPQNLITLSLSAGDWDVWGAYLLQVGGSGIAQFGVGLSQTSLAIPAPTISQAAAGSACAMSAGANLRGSVGPVRANVTTATTYYLAAYSAGASTSQASGVIMARRVR
jgi:hypothetical protein